MLALGLGLTALLELTNVRVRQEKDLAGIVPVSVLVGIPHLSTPGEARSRVREMVDGAWRSDGIVVLIVAWEPLRIHQGLNAISNGEFSENNMSRLFEALSGLKAEHRATEVVTPLPIAPPAGSSAGTQARGETGTTLAEE